MNFSVDELKENKQRFKYLNIELIQNKTKVSYDKYFWSNLSAKILLHLFKLTLKKKEYNKNKREEKESNMSMQPTSV